MNPIIAFTPACHICGKDALKAHWDREPGRRLCAFHERITQPGIVCTVRPAPVKK